VVRVMNRQVTSLALTFLVFLSACPSPLPSETPAPIDAGEHQDDAGILGCEQAGFQEMADAMPLPLNQIGYVKEAFEVLDSSSTGPEECFQLIVKNAAGGLVPSSVTRHSEGHLISFVPSEPGRYCYSFQSLGQRPVSALFWLYKNVHSACVDVRVRPNAAQACLKLSRACVHTATARGHFACDESLYAFDGGLVGTLKDGGFFIGEGNLLAAFESSRLTNINVTTRLERGTPTDSIFPAQWAIAGSRLAVSDGDSGVTFVIDAGQLVPSLKTNRSSRFLKQDKSCEQTKALSAPWASPPASTKRVGLFQRIPRECNIAMANIRPCTRFTRSSEWMVACLRPSVPTHFVPGFSAHQATPVFLGGVCWWAIHSEFQKLTRRALYTRRLARSRGIHLTLISGPRA
jgi:hypothetical protein